MTIRWKPSGGKRDIISDMAIANDLAERGMRYKSANGSDRSIVHNMSSSFGVSRNPCIYGTITDTWQEITLTVKISWTWTKLH